VGPLLRPWLMAPPTGLACLAGAVALVVAVRVSEERER
jgi:hypothetical protein